MKDHFKITSSLGLLITFLVLSGATHGALSPGRMQPIVSESVVFEESNGLLAVEAEHFFKQTDHDVRGWYLTTKDLQAGPENADDDADPAHVGGASGGA